MLPVAPLWLKWAWWWELEKERGYQWSLNHSVISPLCKIIHACSTNHSGRLRQQNAPADPICTPSRFALSCTHKSPMQHKRVNDSLCFVVGNRTKANDNNKSIKLSSSEHISSFLSAHQRPKMHILHAAPPPKQQATVGLTIPSAAREDLINDWSELLCHRWGRSPPTVSYIILTALLFSCLLSIQRPVIGVMLCTG